MCRQPLGTATGVFAQGLRSRRSALDLLFLVLTRRSTSNVRDLFTRTCMHLRLSLHLASLLGHADGAEAAAAAPVAAAAAAAASLAAAQLACRQG